MKIAVISDIHGNLEAFKKVLTDIGNVQIEEIVCLGDNVGYGPEPEEVVRLIRQRHIPCVLGNHEQVLTQPRFLKRMNPSTRKSADITKDLLSSDTVGYCHSLQPTMTYHGARCVHGCPPDSATTYLFAVSETRLKRLFRAMDERICFAGHTHDLEIISFDGKEVTRNTLDHGLVDLDRNSRYIINAGSVGQPRDGNNNAKYLIWDTVAATIDVRFVPYDIAKTADKILELGFPEFNAKRLW
jgi:predicted phosphodiesterase